MKVTKKKKKMSPIISVWPRYKWNNKAPGGVPALSHAVHVSGPDHEERNISQRHQQVLPSARLPVGAPPRSLEREAAISGNAQSIDQNLTLAATGRPLGKSRRWSVGVVGGAWTWRSVPGRCRCPGEPRRAGRR